MSSLLCVGQVDYQGKPTYISTTDSLVRVDWIIKSSAKCEVSFDHHVMFTNILDDKLNLTQVVVELFRNKTSIKKYIFTTGDGVENWILESNIKLKKDDNLYFIFYLKTNKDEKYIFSIYKKKYEYIISNKTDEPISVATQLDKINSYHTNKSTPKNKPNKFMIGVVSLTGFLLGIN